MHTTNKDYTNLLATNHHSFSPQLQAMRFYLKNFFYEYPTYRTEVLSALSLLDSSLPELNFLSMDILTNLLRIATTSLSESLSPSRPAIASELETSTQLDPKKKVSDSEGAASGWLMCLVAECME